MLMCVAFNMAAGCGGGTGKSGGATATKDEFRRRTVTVAAAVDKKHVTAESVAAVRVIEKTGLTSQPLATTTEFDAGFFKCDNINFYILKKKGFIVEFRDVIVLRKIIWNIGDRYNNAGRVDEASTFIAENIMEVLKQEKSPAPSLGFFVRYFNDVDVMSLIDTRDRSLLDSRRRAFMQMLEMWIEIDGGLIEDVIDWPALRFADDRQTKKNDFAKCAILMMMLDEPEFRELAVWQRPLFIAYSDLVYSIASEAAVKLSSEKRKTAMAEKLILEIVQSLTAEEDAIISTALESDVDLFEMLPERAVDEKFTAKTLDDLDYDRGKLVGYLVAEAKRKTPYDGSLGAAGNVKALFDVYNDALEACDFDEKVEKKLYYDIASISEPGVIDLDAVKKQLIFADEERKEPE